MRFRGQLIGTITLAIMVMSGVAAGASTGESAAGAQTVALDESVASQTVQRAFDVYRGNRMDRVALIRPALNAPWTRIEGAATADQALAELSDLSQLHAAR